DCGHDPAGGGAEQVVREVVDLGVLDRDHARQGLEDHPVPDLVARERDDEGGHADQGDDRALEGADDRRRGDRGQDAHPPLQVRAVRPLQLGDDDARDAADERDRQVDLADQEHEDDAVRDQRRPRHRRDDVLEVRRRPEVWRREGEDQDDDAERDDDRRAAQVAGADVVPDPLRQRGERDGLRFGRLAGRGHAGAEWVDGIPETFVGCPAVIASTICCWVVVERSYTPTLRPRRSTVIRFAVSNTSCRLCEIRTTASPCSASRLTSASTCSVCATPSAAVGSSRITSFEFHITALATATVCRIDPIVVTRRLFSVSRVLASIGGSLRTSNRFSSRPRYMFWTTSRLSQSARSW